MPVLQADGSRFVDHNTYPGYTVHRYRPRIEGLFARIERWTRDKDGDVHWRSISKDNILTIYGKDKDSRISEPDYADPEKPGRVFSWLISETRDDKGNAIVYSYQAEDGQDVDLGHANERNRGERNDPRRKINRYLKRIRYGNQKSLLAENGKRPQDLAAPKIEATHWLFEVVFDYDEGHLTNGTITADQEVLVEASSTATHAWTVRADPFSAYRSGFEVRTYRLCRRVMMFHHFAEEAEVGLDCLVRSTDFTYSPSPDPTNVNGPVYSFLMAATQCGYVHRDNKYLKRSLPPVEFTYSQPEVQSIVEEVDLASLENLPIGVDGAAYQWTDLHGEGIPGILTEQAGTWLYKRNISPIGKHPVEFAPLEQVGIKPNLTLASGAQFMDLAGDGQPDLVVFDSLMPGLYEHGDDEGWQQFRPFSSLLNRDMRDPNLRFVDLNGDGHADVLITEDDAFVWHPSLAEEGFGPAYRVAQALDEERGPRLVFADSTQSIYLADLSGDGLTDLARVRNGEVCYWPNLGYGRFGAKVTMDHAPHFDQPDQFDQRRIRLADIDGSGTTDIIYLHGDGVRIYFNQSGNSWSEPHFLQVFPHVDDLVDIAPADLLGNGTACLVWSSPLPGDRRRPMRYVNLMGGHKPHLLIKTVNNLGAETRVRYAPSTYFYLQDKCDGKPWITRLPFPVHVVERVETHDHNSHNHFVTRYAYHHGYFDGEEREFRGFGMVEQWDTEEFEALVGGGPLGEASNLEAASHVPPVLTRTWFHTGIYVNRDHVSNFFAGLLNDADVGEYYREPAWRDDDVEAIKRLLPDTELPSVLSLDEEREACRALKGSMLRQEVYALDGVGQDLTYPFGHPYTVVEQNFTVRLLQPHGSNRHTVFFTHPREAITYHYERNSEDPRIQHALTLDVDPYGIVLKEVIIGYGRRQPDPSLPLQADRDKQTQTLITYTENRVARDPVTYVIDTVSDYRTPLPAETRTYELTGFKLEKDAIRFSFDEWTRNDFALLTSAAEIFYEQTADHISKQKRLIEHVRTLYRPNDCGAAQNNPLALLPLGVFESLALPGETYKLAFTPGLLAQVFQRDGEVLLPDAASVLGGKGSDKGGYADLDGNGHWWIPSGRVFLSPNSPDSNHAAAQELDYARQSFFLPHRYRDPFHTSETSTETIVTYDTYDLFITETIDPLKNTVKAHNNYRVLQPDMVVDPNRNCTQVAFDALGLVVGTAVMGKEKEPDGKAKGDSLDGFQPDLTRAQIEAIMTRPREPGPTPSESVATEIVHALLGKATTRIVYNLDCYQCAAQPPFAATVAREIHVSELEGNQRSKLQISFSYSDGFGREIQKKIQAEPGPTPRRVDGKILVGTDGQPVMTESDTSPRWVGSGWTVFNNKGKPTRQYEPFFSDTHHFEFDVRLGVSPILFYDPVERIIATLHPNHTYEKVVFDPWQQKTWDVNDTINAPVNPGDHPFDPKDDPDVGQYFKRLPDNEYLPTWFDLRTDAAKALQAWPDIDSEGHPHPENARCRAAERIAAAKASAHANTPTLAHFDTLGRPFLTQANNGLRPDGTSILYSTRVDLDIEGNQRAVIDAKDRIIMRYDYDMLGNPLYQASVDAGRRWTLPDVAGTAIHTWDDRNFSRRMTYDGLRRLVELFVSDNGDPEFLAEKTEYGENKPQPELTNHRMRAWRVLDGAGVVTSDAYDFKGNLCGSTRQLLMNYWAQVNWLENPAVEDEFFTNSTSYDALNRPVEIIAPHSSKPDTKLNMIHSTYNEANLLERVEAKLNSAAVATVFVKDIDYNAKGQRTSIQYGNDVETEYDFDAKTFRLTHLMTLRPETFARDKRRLQDLSYTYDPVGNITRIVDQAQPRTYFDNDCIDASNDYEYDAIYRLIGATGREHKGQDLQPDWDDTPRMGNPIPYNCRELCRYTESYRYDEVGNILQMIHHQGDNLNSLGPVIWNRRYQYHPDNNRLRCTSMPGEAVQPEYSTDPLAQYASRYTYDDHGNMTSMPHLPLMQWNFIDQLHATSRQVRNDSGTSESTYYVYDATGQRMRKVTERQAPAGEMPRRKDERIYLGGIEVFRKYNGNDENELELERETLHIMDDQQRIALLETRSWGDDGSHQQYIRYQLGNHLGSASLELDIAGEVVSYEEYYPYGSTSYQAAQNQTMAPKRCRYSGKERDEESGLSFHGARYYGPWLARWSSCDPIRKADEPNLYQYVKGNPLSFVDAKGTDLTKPLNLQQEGNVTSESRDMRWPFSSTMRDAQTKIREIHELYKREKPGPWVSRLNIKVEEAWEILVPNLRQDIRINFSDWYQHELVGVEKGLDRIFERYQPDLFWPGMAKISAALISMEMPLGGPIIKEIISQDIDKSLRAEAKKLGELRKRYHEHLQSRSLALHQPASPVFEQLMKDQLFRVRKEYDYIVWEKGWSPMDPKVHLYLQRFIELRFGGQHGLDEWVATQVEEQLKVPVQEAICSAGPFYFYMQHHCSPRLKLLH